MIRINRYVRRHVLGGIAMVLLVFLGLDSIVSLIDQQGQMAGDYGFGAALVHTLMTLPGRLSIYVPFVVLIGCLVGVGQMAVSSELVILRASGISIGHIIVMAAKPALLFAAVCLLLGEFVAPGLERDAKLYQQRLQWKGSETSAQYGVWLRDGRQFASVSALQADGTLYGLSLYQVDENWHVERAIQARRAFWRDGSWLLEQVEQTRFLPDRTERDWQEQLRWHSSITPDRLRVLMLKPRDLSLRELRYYATYLEQQGLDASEYWLNFWGDSLKILAIASLVLVAVSFVFGPLRGASLGLRVFVGIVIGVAFNTLQNLLGPASMVFGFSPLIAVLLPILLTALIGVWLLRRTG